MKYAIASEQEYEDLDEVYHYLSEGEEKTLCGLTPHHVWKEKPDMRLCKRCERIYYKGAGKNAGQV